MAKKGAAQQGSGAKRPKRLSYEERQRVGGCAIHFCSIAVPALELTICVPAGRGARGVALSGRQHHRRAGRGRRCSAHRQPRSAGEHARCPTCQAVKPVLGRYIPIQARTLLLDAPAAGARRLGAAARRLPTRARTRTRTRRRSCGRTAPAPRRLWRSGPTTPTPTPTPTDGRPPTGPVVGSPAPGSVHLTPIRRSAACVTLRRD